jgi:hypothetical protein
LVDLSGHDNVNAGSPKATAGGVSTSASTRRKPSARANARQVVEESTKIVPPSD